MKRNEGGFTIIELIIVIVVIAILATIGGLAYNGAQQRARDTETASDVKHYKDALGAYLAFKGSYPSVSAPVCLGQGYPSGKCWLSEVSEDAAFMEALKQYSDTLPKLKQGVYLRGGIFVPASNHTKLDGVDRNFIAYTVTKSGKCPYGPVVTFISGQLFSSATPPSGQSVPPNDGGDVQCWIVLD